MKKRLFTFLCLNIFFIAGGVSAQETQNDQAIIANLETVRAAVSTTAILLGDEGERLSEAIAYLSARSDDLNLFRMLALNVTQKVVYDRGAMQFILTDLETLAKDEYSSKVGGIDFAVLKGCQDAMGRLIEDMAAMRPRFNKPSEPLNAADYHLIIERNSPFLTGKGNVATTQETWSAIVQQLDKAYPLWNEKHEELLAKIKAAEGKKPEEVLTNDELKFAKTFSRVKLYRYMLSGV